MRLFKWREVREAIKHAAGGGQALHVYKAYDAPGAPAVFKRHAQWSHLFDQDKKRLIATARRLGVRKIVVGHPGTLRQPLERAKELVK